MFETNVFDINKVNEIVGDAFENMSVEEMTLVQGSAEISVRSISTPFFTSLSVGIAVSVAARC